MTNVLRLSGVTLPGSGYPNLKNFVTPSFPVATGLVGLYCLGGSMDMSVQNRVNAALPLTPIGAPTINQLGAVCGGANGFDTGILSSNGLTIMVVAKPLLAVSQPTSAMLVSTYQQGSPSTGDSLTFQDVSAASRLQATLNTPTGVTGNSFVAMPGDTDTAKWNTFAMRVSTGGVSRAFWQKSGVPTLGVAGPATTRAITGRTFRIGSNYTGGPNFHANVEIQMVAIFQADLADAGVNENLAYLHDVYGPAIGVTTL